MPTVPTYNEDVFTQPIRTGGISGGYAIPNVPRFETFKGVQDTAVKIYEQELTDANNLAVTEAISNLNNAITELDDKARKSKGRDSIGIENKITAEYQVKYKEIEGMLSNDTQKNAFRINGLKIGDSFRKGLTTYEREEGFRYKESVFDTAIKTFAESASINPQMFADNISNGIGLIDKAAQDFGWDDKQKERNKMLFMTETTDKRIKNLIAAERPEEAETLLKGMSGAIDPDTETMWKEKLSNLSSDEKSVRIGNELWRDNFNAQTGVFKYFDASKDERFTSQPKKVQDKIDQYLRTLDGKFKEQRKQETESNINDINTMLLSKKTFDDIRKEYQYKNLDGTHQRLVEKSIIADEIENAKDVVYRDIYKGMSLGQIKKQDKAEYDTLVKYKPEWLITIQNVTEAAAIRNNEKQIRQDTFNKIIESRDSLMKVSAEELMVLQSQNMLTRGQVSQIQQYQKKYDFRVFNAYKNLVSLINGSKFSDDKNKDTESKVKLKGDLYNTMLLSGNVDENNVSLISDEWKKKVFEPVVSNSIIDRVTGKLGDVKKGIEQRAQKVQQADTRAKVKIYDKPPDAGAKEWQDVVITNPDTGERMKSVKSGNKWIWKKLTGASGGF